MFSFPSPPPARPAAVGEQGGPRHRHKSSSERCKDYFHGSRAVPLMRLTQKWTRHYMARHWHDRMGLLFFYCCWFFSRLLDEPRQYFLSWHTGISTASSCTSLRFTAAGSLDGPAAPIASLLMDLHTGFFSCMWCAPTCPNGLWITKLPADFRLLWTMTPMRAWNVDSEVLVNICLKLKTNECRVLARQFVALLSNYRIWCLLN